MSTDRWHNLASKGARRQRLLWASTSTKDPAYSDTYYVDALVGPNTVDTMTLETFRAYLDHGRPETMITKNGRSREMVDSLAPIGIDFPGIAQELEDDGVRLFAESFDKAVKTIADRRRRRKNG